MNAEVPSHRFFDPVPGLSGQNAAAFAHNSDRLVRHLFDVGLQLHTLRAVFELVDATSEQIHEASDTVGSVLVDLDMLLRDVGLAMLALNSAATTTGCRS
ncbi:hypothetical protein CRH09_32255 [Nocardia terpenica]|uniref:Uncharacterized protein n=2 Tax=Nocardia terpenica TaxID=455432 RepID=A0A291RSF9_9NOCA|nr:hypothetical protein CRH09_32255 [Nocardia terpenica]